MPYKVGVHHEKNIQIPMSMHGTYVLRGSGAK